MFFTNSGLINYTSYNHINKRLSASAASYFETSNVSLKYFHNTVLHYNAPLRTRVITLDFRVQKLETYWPDVYIKPYIRCTPYIMGILIGFALYKFTLKPKFPRVRLDFISLCYTMVHHRDPSRIFSGKWLLAGLFP